MGERGELLPQGEVLEDQVGAASQGGAEGGKEESDEAEHGRTSVGSGDGEVNDLRWYEFWRTTGEKIRMKDLRTSYATQSH